MNFNEALECLKNGKKVKRLWWTHYKHMELIKFKNSSPDFEVTLSDCQSKDLEGKIQSHALNAEDIFADDWEIVK